ncbi:MAG: hypothetical protein N4A72_00805 [Bacteroidales bacterium]|jgi:hypothetical protein|nr:hypothetical protein [Bacteroidales bacterium]
MSQRQKISDGSSGIQINGNVNCGISYSDVRDIVLDLFKQNFPKLLEEAKEQALQNLKEYEKHLDESLKRRLEDVDFNKFKDPNTQYILNNSISYAARKGKKIDLDLLSETLVTSLLKSNTDILNIISEQAVEIIPKLTLESINMLTFLFSFFNIRMVVSESISETEEFYKKIIETHSIPANNKVLIGYMESLGILSNLHIGRNDVYNKIKLDYPGIYKNSSKSDIQEDIQKNAPNLFKVIKMIEDNRFDKVELTPLGMLISLINMRNYLPSIDYNEWIN